MSVKLSDCGHFHLQFTIYIKKKRVASGRLPGPSLTPYRLTGHPAPSLCYPVATLLLRFLAEPLFNKMKSERGCNQYYSMHSRNSDADSVSHRLSLRFSPSQHIINKSKELFVLKETAAKPCSITFHAYPSEN